MGLPGAGGQLAGVFRAEHGLGEPAAHQACGAGGVGAAKDQDIAPDAGRAQVQRLGQAAHRKPFGAGGLQRAAHHAVAVAVGPGLDHRAHLGGGGMGLEKLEIMHQRVQIHLGPAVLFKIHG